MKILGLILIIISSASSFGFEETSYIISHTIVERETVTVLGAAPPQTRTSYDEDIAYLSDAEDRTRSHVYCASDNLNIFSQDAAYITIRKNTKNGYQYSREFTFKHKFGNEVTCRAFAKIVNETSTFESTFFLKWSDHSFTYDIVRK